MHQQFHRFTDVLGSLSSASHRFRPLSFFTRKSWPLSSARTSRVPTRVRSTGARGRTEGPRGVDLWQLAVWCGNAGPFDGELTISPPVPGSSRNLGVWWVPELPKCLVALRLLVTLGHLGDAAVELRVVPQAADGHLGGLRFRSQQGSGVGLFELERLGRLR